MKTMLLSFAMLVTFSATSQAALSGYYDSAAKIKVALASQELAAAMKQAPIEAITVNDASVLVKSNGCAYAVHLDVKQPAGGMVGATSYSVFSVVGPMCLGLKQ